MEQLNDLLGYVSVFLWAFGICQVKATRDKKRWVLSGIFGIGAVLIIFLYFKNELLYWIKWLLFFLLFMFLIEEKWKRKVVLLLFSIGYIDVISTPIRTVMVIIEFIRKKELNSILGTILEFLCILGLTYYIKKHDKIAEWLKKLPTSYYFVGFLCSFMATGASTYVEMDLENKSYNERIMISILMMVTVELLYIMCIGAAVIATFCKNYKEESLLKDEYLRLSKQHYETLLKNTQEIRSLRHDMQSHVNALSYFSKEKDWEKLQAYIEEVKASLKGLTPFGEKVRIKVDNRNKSSVDKFWEWTRKGAPVICEIGMRDAEGGKVMVKERLKLGTPEGKEIIAREEFARGLSERLENIQHQMSYVPKPGWKTISARISLLMRSLKSILPLPTALSKTATKTRSLSSAANGAATRTRKNC